MAEIIVRAPWCLRYRHAPVNFPSLTFTVMRASLQEWIVESQYFFYSLVFYCLLFTAFSRWVCTPTPPLRGTFNLSEQFLIPSLPTPPAPLSASAKRGGSPMISGFNVHVPPDAQKKPMPDTQIGRAVNLQIRQIFDSQKFDLQIKQSLMSVPNPPVLKNMFSNTSGKTYSNETVGNQSNGRGDGIGNGGGNGRGSGIGLNAGTSAGGIIGKNAKIGKKRYKSAYDLERKASELFEHSHYEGALKLYLELRDNFPDDACVRSGIVLFMVSCCLYNLDRFEEAIEADETYLNQYPNNPTVCAGVLYFLGYAYFKVGNKTKAKQIWERTGGEHP